MPGCTTSPFTLSGSGSPRPLAVRLVRLFFGRFPRILIHWIVTEAQDNCLLYVSGGLCRPWRQSPPLTYNTCTSLNALHIIWLSLLQRTCDGQPCPSHHH